MVHCAAAHFFKDDPSMTQSFDSTALLTLSMMVEEQMRTDILSKDSPERILTEASVNKAPTTNNLYGSLIVYNLTYNDRTIQQRHNV